MSVYISLSAIALFPFFFYLGDGFRNKTFRWAFDSPLYTILISSGCVSARVLRLTLSGLFPLNRCSRLTGRFNVSCFWAFWRITLLGTRPIRRLKYYFRLSCFFFLSLCEILGVAWRCLLDWFFCWLSR